MSRGARLTNWSAPLFDTIVTPWFLLSSANFAPRYGPSLTHDGVLKNIMEAVVAGPARRSEMTFPPGAKSDSKRHIPKLNVAVHGIP
jgi:hypothetical protein